LNLAAKGGAHEGRHGSDEADRQKNNAITPAILF
jgi:hypothetical protein